MTPTTAKANTEIIDRIREEAVENGKMDVIEEAVKNDYVLHTPTVPEPIHGPDGFKQYKRTLRAAFPDLSVTIADRVVREETVVDRYRMRGTHEGEFDGIAPTGTEIEFTGIVIHYLEDGKLIKNVAEFNVLDLTEQLGVVEPPGESHD